jgi:hypothetical protein
MKTKITHGAEIETLTPAELKAGLTATTASWFQEMARGLSTARFTSTATISGAAVTFPPPGETRIGPEVGFAWAVQRVSAYGLDSADVLQVFRNVAVPETYLGQITTASPMTLGSKAVILRSDERLVITGTSLTATGTIAVNGEAVELPEMDLYKLF